MLESLVRGDHGHAERHLPQSVGIGGFPPATTTTTSFDTLLRWYYPDQVLRVGGAVAALSARLPEPPARSAHGSACRVRRGVGGRENREDVQPVRGGRAHRSS